MRTFPAIIGLIVILLLASVPVQAVTPITDFLSVSGDDMEVDGLDYRLKGINDQTVLPLNLYPYPAYNYRYHNHLFSDGGGGYIGDALTKLPSDNYTHFWWQYFYLIQQLGLNSVRLGGFNGWGMSWLHQTWYNDRPTWDAIVDPMFAMAQEAGVYIIFSFGGEANPDYTFSETTSAYGTSVPSPMAGSLVDVGSECYLHYISWIGEVMTEYASEPSIGMWELLNEPDGDVPYYHYWHTLPNEDASWKAWNQAIVAAAVAEEHSHIITQGTCMGIFHGYGETEFINMNNASVDVTHSHMYMDVEDSYLIYQPANWSINLNKAWLLGEAGRADVAPPWGIYYWPWLDAQCQLHDASVIWMTLWRMPGYPVWSSNISSIPGIPAGYVYPDPDDSGGGGGGGGGDVPPVEASAFGIENAGILFVIGAGIFLGMIAGKKKR